jgi:hypothetical protein
MEEEIESIEKAKEKVVPSLEIDAKNRIVEQRKNIPLIVNGKEVFVIIKKLNTGIRNQIRSECSKITVVGGQSMVKVDERELQEKILSQAIVEAPFEVSVGSIKSLPSDVTDYLFDAYNEFAEPSLKKKVE